MPIANHPRTGSVLLCNFDTGFYPPEMVKRRPVVVISPKIAARPGLCTVVCLSTTAPENVMPYHCQIDIRPKLPTGFDSDGVWVKGDMIYSVALNRLDFFRFRKSETGKRQYYYDALSDYNIKRIRQCVLQGMGMSALTKHL
ncbi:MAG: type II toxin-antitoxin system PemK/MazF family toxin [Alphaproteobacteria bacterium]|nr:MAG: type II toxin-antitoxin system PemK/MazF family toxin [Alphaproteobacteria bacterium]